MRRALLALAMTSLAPACAGEAEYATDGAESAVVRAEAEDRLRIPLNEVSGLTVRTTSRGRELIAISDSDYRIAVGPIDERNRVAFRTIDVGGLMRAGGYVNAAGPQWEAVATDGTGRIFVLEENPGRLFVFDAGGARIEQVVPLEIDGKKEMLDGLDGDWRREPNSRGEGLILLANGHVLLLKEKKPRRLVELGPKGDAPTGFRTGAEVGSRIFPTMPKRLVSLHVWEFKDGNTVPDLSDLSIGEDGRVYALSDEGAVIARIKGPIDPKSDAQLDFDLVRPLRGIEKPEGLAMLPGNRAFVASDTKSEDPNLAIVKVD